MTLEELEAYLEEKGLKDKWKRNGKYWTSRFELLEDSMNNKCNDYFYDLERIYTKAISETEKDILKWYNRFAKNEKITLAEAKQTLNKNDLKEFRMTLREYIEKGESLDPRWLNELERASIKVHVSRLEALKIQMQQQVESLMGNELDSVDKLLKDIYAKSYYHTAFEIQKGIGVGWDLMKLDTNAINKVMSKPWTADGINFSERIWGKYRPELIKKLHDGLTINIIRGESSDKLINDITKAFEVKKSQAKNLVRTEKAFFMTTSQCDCFNDLGVKEYEIVATLDNKTSDICRAMDGKVFDMKDFQAGSTAPPFHNQCRSTTAPYFNDEFTIDELRAARDEEDKYYTVPSNMKYPEWYDKYVEGKEDLTKDGNSAIEKVKEFKYASTIEEAEEFVRDELGIPRVSYKGCDMITINEWNKGLHDSFNRFPELKNNFGFVGECRERNRLLKPIIKEQLMEDMLRANPSWNAKDLEPYVERQLNKFMRAMSVSKNTFAQSWSPDIGEYKKFAGVTVNADWGKDSSKFISSLVENVESKFHPIGCDTIRSVLDHEIGHQLDDMLGISEIEKVKNLFDKRTQKELTEDISEYAWNNNNKKRYSEMIAEAWAEYCNNPEPREIAKTIGETIEKLYKEKFKK